MGSHGFGPRNAGLPFVFTFFPHHDPEIVCEIMNYFGADGKLNSGRRISEEKVPGEHSSRVQDDYAEENEEVRGVFWVNDLIRVCLVIGGNGPS